jgi:hypothetical protein
MTARISRVVSRLCVVLLLTSALIMGGPLTAGTTGTAPEIVGGSR